MASLNTTSRPLESQQPTAPFPTTAGTPGSDAAAAVTARMGLERVPRPLVSAALLPLLTADDMFCLKLVSKDFRALVLLDPRHGALWQLVLLRTAQGALTNAGEREQQQELSRRFDEIQASAADVFRPLIDARLARSLPVPHADALKCVRQCMETIVGHGAESMPDAQLFDAKRLVAWSADDMRELYWLLAEGGAGDELRGNLAKTEARLLQLAVSNLTGFQAPESVAQSLTMDFTPTRFTATFVDPDGPGAVVWGALPMWSIPTANAADR